MRALDLFVERQVIDRSIDCQAKTTLSREANEANCRDHLVLGSGFTPQDKVAIASASIMLGSPFLLFGLGTTFAIIDECDFQRQNRQMKTGWLGGARPFGARKAITSSDELEKTRSLELTIPMKLVSSDVSTQSTRKSKKPLSRFGDAPQIGIKGVNKLFAPPAKSWLEASKLVKRKQTLLDQMERINHGQNFSAVSRLLSQIEVLDKALKQMGC